MSTMSITVGGGQDATPESFPTCDSCGAADVLKEWESPSAKVYSYCKTCWFDIEESANELMNLKYAEDDMCACDDCGGQMEFPDGESQGDCSLHCCEECRQSLDTLEPEAKRQALQCEDCSVLPATKMFLHLSGETYQLCDACFQAADHEDDYGTKLGPYPELRNGKYCGCPLPSNYKVSNRCELCCGLVVAPVPEKPYDQDFF